MAIYEESEILIASVKDLLGILERHHSERLLFRGQNVDQPLRPKFARLTRELERDTRQLEDQIYARFKKESLPYVASILRPESPDLDWLTVAQHYGLPTRLLDWTANPIVALWFSVAGDIEKPVMWVFEVDKEDILYPNRHGEDYRGLERTYVFQPFHIDARVPAQSGWFSVHKYLIRKKRFVALDRNRSIKGKLTKYFVSADKVATIKTDLLRMGVNPAALFPGLAGLCERLLLDTKLQIADLASGMVLKEPSDEQIRRRGLEVLHPELGPAGLIRFLQQFEPGAGDYSVERHNWLREHSLEDLLRDLKRQHGQTG